MTEIKQQFDQIIKEYHDSTEEKLRFNQSYLQRLETLSQKAFDEGNFYISAECLKQAANITYESSQFIDEQKRMIAANKYDKASKRFHSINHYKEAAECIEEAARIYIEQRKLREAIKCYGLAKNYYGDNGDYDKCGEAYLKEMECKRKHYWNVFIKNKKFSEKFSYFFRCLKYESFKWITGYGEKLKNLFISSLIINLIFIIYYYFSNDVTIIGGDNNNPFFITKEESKIEYLYSCILFSLSLFSGFSTTPYLLESNNWISVVEVISGNLILALFIAVVLRKVSRR
ncbi:hypothetical protein SAMN05880501_10932 [Ureibacillus xyleni]|uniref:Ion channel n=1 Tax=Ureibacillus xyleni TaxID=614648 RepID=A0A285T5D3_9BACL|nr:hypothetical protein [Ureibacillus xyleni]SOC16582.1 hypothetical protein SAMN05880501_10932 [Ureibacillus xyleni]